MKNVFCFLVALVPFFISGCSNPTPELFELKQAGMTIELYVGDTFQLEANQNAKFWLTDNPYSAVVSDAGLVVAEFVGVATITAVFDDDNIQKCNIRIIPRYETYIEPVWQLFGKPLDSLDELFELEHRTVVEVGERGMRLKGDLPYEEEVTYGFSKKNGKITIDSAYIFLPVTLKNEVFQFLNERYKYYNLPVPYYLNWDKSMGVTATPSDRIGIRYSWELQFDN